MEKLGFVDSYRATNPQITTETLGHTWTTVGPHYKYKEGEGFVPAKGNPEPEYRDPFARIDYIYAKGPSITPLESNVLTHHSSDPDEMFPAFPSDHGAVVTRFAID